jgi:hypothetical protein
MTPILRGAALAAAIGGVVILSGCGADASFSQAPNPTDSCTIRITNPNIPGAWTDMKFSGRGADYQCTGMLNMIPAGGAAERVDAPSGPEACSTSVGGLTVIAYTNDPLAAQNGCAWMRKRTQQLGG